MEKIICAAIWYKNFDKPIHSPINIDKGVVMCGHRHGHIIGQMLSIANLRTCTFAEDATGEFIQGFLTDKNRFLDRNEAHALFILNGGIPEFEQLYSEDLY